MSPPLLSETIVLTVLLCFRCDISGNKILYNISLKITCDPCNVINFPWPVWYIDRIFIPGNETTLLKHNNQSDFRTCLKKSSKLQENERHFVMSEWLVKFVTIGFRALNWTLRKTYKTGEITRYRSLGLRERKLLTIS